MRLITCLDPIWTLEAVVRDRYVEGGKSPASVRMSSVEHRRVRSTVRMSGDDIIFKIRSGYQVNKNTEQSAFLQLLLCQSRFTLLCVFLPVPFVSRSRHYTHLIAHSTT